MRCNNCRAPRTRVELCCAVQRWVYCTENNPGPVPAHLSKCRPFPPPRRTAIVHSDSSVLTTGNCLFTHDLETLGRAVRCVRHRIVFVLARGEATQHTWVLLTMSIEHACTHGGTHPHSSSHRINGLNWVDVIDHFCCSWGNDVRSLAGKVLAAGCCTRCNRRAISSLWQLAHGADRSYRGHTLCSHFTVRSSVSPFAVSGREEGTYRVHCANVRALRVCVFMVHCKLHQD